MCGMDLVQHLTQRRSDAANISYPFYGIIVIIVIITAVTPEYQRHKPEQRDVNTQKFLQHLSAGQATGRHRAGGTCGEHSSHAEKGHIQGS